MPQRLRDNNNSKAILQYPQQCFTENLSCNIRYHAVYQEFSCHRLADTLDFLLVLSRLASSLGLYSLKYGTCSLATAVSFYQITQRALNEW